MRSLLQTSEKKSSVDSSRSEQQAAVVVVGTQEAKEPLSLRKSTSSGRWCNMDVEEVAAILLTNTERGLCPEEASERLRIGGFNELPVTKSKAFLRALFSNTFNPMNGILLLALVFCFAVQDVINAAVLLIVMLSNSIIGFIQEYRCENTMEALKSMASPTARVVRNQDIEVIPGKELVVGDVVVLFEGDVVPADLRLVECFNLEVDEAILTGESVPVVKKAGRVLGNQNGLDIVDNTASSTRPVALSDRLNMAFSSCRVTRGRGKGIVVSIGSDTQLGQIGKGLSNDETPVYKTSKTPLQVSLNRMMYVCLVIAILLVLVVFWVCGWQFNSQVLLYSVGVAVAILPEGLPAVIIVTMAAGVRRMAKSKAIVRKFASLEALGQVTNICSDKTGTLTEGKMNARKAWIAGMDFEITGTGIIPIGDLIPLVTANNIVGKSFSPVQISTSESLETFFMICSLCNSSSLFFDESAAQWKATGSPTEIALLVLATKLGYSKNILITDPKFDMTFLHEYGFDSTVKRMTVTYADKDGNVIHLAKGAYERMIEICKYYIDKDDQVKLIDDNFILDVENTMLQYAKGGKRVIALAYRREQDAINDNHTDSQSTVSGTTTQFLADEVRSNVERDFVFVGLVGIYDPPREESARSVESCRRAGISVHMITGDHPVTAEAIAKEIGIIHTNDHSSSVCVTATSIQSLVCTGPDFDGYTDEYIDSMEQLPLVLARCSPETKVKFVDALHRRKKFVAMTGDGVNDAPAIKKADVGIAMGLGGSDVTKEASSITLTDDNFHTIYVAIREGRRLFENSRKVSLHLLSGNVSEVVALICGLAIHNINGQPEYPMSPIQVLWLNMVTSSPIALALGLEHASADIMNHPPREKGKSSLWTLEFVLDNFVYGILIGMQSLSSFIICLNVGGGVGRTMYNIPGGCNHPGFNENCNYVYVARAVTFYSHSLLLLFHGLNCRHQRQSIYTKGRPTNKWLWMAIAIGLAMVIPTAYLGDASEIAFTQREFGWQWGIVLANVVIFLMLSELYKIIKRRFWR